MVGGADNWRGGNWHRQDLEGEEHGGIAWGGAGPDQERAAGPAPEEDRATDQQGFSERQVPGNAQAGMERRVESVQRPGVRSDHVQVQLIFVSEYWCAVFEIVWLLNFLLKLLALFLILKLWVWISFCVSITLVWNKFCWKILKYIVYIHKTTDNSTVVSYY